MDPDANMLWIDDEGDMSRECRDALAALLVKPFVTVRNTVTGGGVSLITVISEDERGERLIRRDLDNLGRELVFDANRGIAYAAQRPDVESVRIRRTATRRTVDNGSKKRLGASDILYMALKLRNYVDDADADFSTDLIVDIDKLSEWFDMSPSGRFYATSGDRMGRDKAFNGCIASLRNDSHGIGLLEKIRAVDAYAVLPSILLVVDDNFSDAVANAPEEPSSDADEFPESVDMEDARLDSAVCDGGTDMVGENDV